MKKSKLIGIGVATIGVALSVGVSLALYVHADAAKQIGIGVFTPHTSEDGDVNYVIDSVTPGVGNAAYSPSHLTNSYSFRLGATKGEDSHLPLQKYTVGDLSIVISSTNETLINNLTATAEIAVPTGKWQDSDSGNITGEKASDGKVELPAAVKDVSGSAKTLTLSLANFVAQTTLNGVDGGTNSIVSLNLALADNLAEATVLNIAEASYTITASWVPPANFVYAYVTGTQYGWSTTDSEARMVPNAKPEGSAFEWMYTDYTDTTPGDVRGAKCVKVNGSTAWSGGNDTPIALNKKYDFYWSGADQGTAYVSEHD